MVEADFAWQHEEDLQRLRGFRLLDDDFMAKVFEDKACAELLLRIILKKNDLLVKEVYGQLALKNLQGRSARLDVFATDSTGKVYNIEVQRSDRGAVAKRARYNAALIDANITEPGEEYQALNECYVIFITENDVIGEGLPIYHAERMILETGKSFGDEQHILYMNAQIKDETELGKLMHDMWCVEPEDMHYGILAERVRYFKENEEGVATMCRAMEQLRNETAEATAFKTTLNAIRELMKNCSWTAEQALLNLGVPEQEHPRYLAAI
ncbi:MAG: PD-(D/E)XK nuclease family transposase [Clostridia bacterium]|nr:PD-(D/E)XK nuclease family transposase [Clostridia bacterium]